MRRLWLLILVPFVPLAADRLGAAAFCRLVAWSRRASSSPPPFLRSRSRPPASAGSGSPTVVRTAGRGSMIELADLMLRDRWREER